MVNSMTGFAALTGQTDEYTWALELKSVNARGLDIRMRLSEGSDVLEPLMKTMISKVAKRGAINVSLRTENLRQVSASTLNPSALDDALAAVAIVEAQAAALGQKLTPSSVTDILAVRGVYEPVVGASDTGPLIAAIKTALPDVVKAFAKSRSDEGTALKAVMADQIETIAQLTKEAVMAAGERSKYVAKRLQENLNLILSETDGVDAARLEQELALLAVKADITEEIDRLQAHVLSAREMLEAKGSIGRKFDFLMQEFNREANTLCSKSGSTDLTRIGLDLKTVIDQMREQVQNVE